MFCFQGRSCGIYLASCKSSPCLNGGTWTNLPNKFNCTCSPEYTGVICAVFLSDGNPAGNTGEDNTPSTAPVIGGIVCGIVVLILLLALVGVAIFRQKKKKKSYSISHSLPEPLVVGNPVYMSGYKSRNPLFEEQSNGIKLCM